MSTAIDARVKAEWDDESEADHRLRTPTQRRADALSGICTDWLNGVASGDSGWTVSGDPNGLLSFTSPSGQVLSSWPRSMAQLQPGVAA